MTLREVGPSEDRLQRANHWSAGFDLAGGHWKVEVDRAGDAFMTFASEGGEIGSTIVVNFPPALLMEAAGALRLAHRKATENRGDDAA